MLSRIATLMVAVVSLILIGPASGAGATDNDTPYHKHSAVWGYNISTSLPTEWRTPVHNAAREWTSGTKLWFDYYGLTSSTSPNTSQRIIWRGSIPSSWQGNCPPADTLACTGVKIDSTNHLTDADMVFNSDWSLGTSNLFCDFDIGLDVETIALHEFGHFGFLDHTSDSGAVMYDAYNDCQRSLASHDVNSMNYQYRNH